MQQQQPKPTTFLYACLPHANKERGVFRRLIASIIQVAVAHGGSIIYIASTDIHEALDQANKKDPSLLNSANLEALCFTHDMSVPSHARIKTTWIKDLKKSPREFESEIAYALVRERCSRAIFVGGFPHNLAGSMDRYCNLILFSNEAARVFLITTLGGSVVNLQENEEHRRKFQTFSNNDYPRLRRLLEHHIFS